MEKRKNSTVKPKPATTTPSSTSQPPCAMSTFWLIFWRIEIFIVLGSTLYWAFMHNNYFVSLFGEKSTDREFFLLLQGAITIFACYVYFYARVLFGEIHLPTFLLFQQAMALGDVLVLVLSFIFFDIFKGSFVTFLAMDGMAAFFLLMRIIFLSNFNA